MSATHTRFGALAANSRSTRSSRPSRPASGSSSRAYGASSWPTGRPGASVARRAFARSARRHRAPVRPDPRRAVHAASLRELSHPRVNRASSTARGDRVRLRPRVVARTRDLKHAAHDRDRVLRLPRSDEPEHHHRIPLSFAKKAAAFFKISRSSASTLTSRRNRRSSSRSSLDHALGATLIASAILVHYRNVDGRDPQLRSSCLTDRPLVRIKRTASCLNSNEYSLRITDPSLPKISQQVST